MNTRKARAKRVKLSDEDYGGDVDGASLSSHVIDPEDLEEARKLKIRDSNKEFARRMTILQTWSEYWSDYSIREGDAYPKLEARAIIKRTKRITCPIPSCGKSFTSVGGLRYHYARCNIERSFKCKVCSPALELATRGELLRHMIFNHYDDLPALNNEQKEIANSYLSYEARSDKSRREKRSFGDTEPSCNSQGLLRAYKELLDRVIMSASFINRPYKDWQSLTTHWEPIILEADRRRFYPPELESLHFKMASNNECTMIKTGEFKILNKDKRGSPTSAIFYTGGINTASAWLPKSHYDKHSSASPELIAVSVDCFSMEKSYTYKECSQGENCIQFWTLGNLSQGDDGTEGVNGSNDFSLTLSYMIGHNYGTIFDMSWCPLGASWQPQVNTGNVLSRIGLLALACGGGQIRILSVPHTQSLLARATTKLTSNALEATPIFKAKPIATLMAPGVGSSTNYATSACKSICWNLEDNQRLIAAGYANGTVALFDLANKSPILYTINDEQHIYQPLKSWIAHGGPVTGVAISSRSLDKTFLTTGSIDRHLKIWNAMDLNACIITDRAPITRVIWDFRFRGVVTATDTAFTSFSNRVTYRYPIADSNHNVTISTHRSTVLGLANSIITGAIATSDLAGELFVMPQMINRSLHKRDKNLLSVNSIYTMVPYSLDDKERESVIVFSPSNLETCKATEENVTNDNNDLEENKPEGEPDFSNVEKQMANKPDNFLLPVEHPAMETYGDFKTNFGLKFVHYDCTTAKPDSKHPESCMRASDIKNIYCDRPCDYPFSAINLVSWSPNLDSLSYLLSATQVGLCRIDKIQLVDQIYRGHVKSILEQPKQIPTTLANDKQ